MRLITTYRTNEMLIRHPSRWRIDVYQALLPFIVISRTECTEAVIRVHSMAVIWHFIGGYLGNPFYAISPHFIPLTRP